MKSFVAMLIVSTFAAGAVFAQSPNPKLQADRQAVNSACQAEAQTAGCPGLVVGKGLLKCIWHYKHANRQAFKVSPGCHSAMKQLRMDRHAMMTGH